MILLLLLFASLDRGEVVKPGLSWGIVTKVEEDEVNGRRIRYASVQFGEYRHCHLPLDLWDRSVKIGDRFWACKHKSIRNRHPYVVEVVRSD